MPPLVVIVLYSFYSSKFYPFLSNGVSPSLFPLTHTQTVTCRLTKERFLSTPSSNIEWCCNKPFLQPPTFTLCLDDGFLTSVFFPSCNPSVDNLFVPWFFQNENLYYFIGSTSRNNNLLVLPWPWSAEPFTYVAS